MEKWNGKSNGNYYSNRGYTGVTDDANHSDSGSMTTTTAPASGIAGNYFHTASAIKEVAHASTAIMTTNLGCPRLSLGVQISSQGTGACTSARCGLDT